MVEKVDIGIKKISDGTAKKLRNLKPFKKGFDPNRNLEGRPVGSVSIVEGIKRKLLEVNPKNKKTWLETFLDKYFDESVKMGKSDLIRDMINRVDGMPKQNNDITSNGKEIKTVLVEFIDGSAKDTNTS